MATIRAFRAVLPNEGFVERVAAPPYDVLTSEEAREMVRDNPYSFLHVDKSEVDLPNRTDPYDDSVYAKAKENLDKLIRDSILVQDDRPGLYIYRLIMNGRTQTGLVACTSVEEYLSGVIKKHELTREDKERDRTRHVRTCRAHTGPIFMAYRKQETIGENLQTWTQAHAPIFDFISSDGIGHQVWRIDDEGVITQLQTAFANVPALYIADGHHRNASAANVSKALRGESQTEDAECHYYLSVIFPDDELLIMDYNRLVKDLNGRTEDELLRELATLFAITPVDTPCKPAAIHQFGMYIGGKWYLLVAKQEIIPDSSDIVAALDVSILQNKVLSPIFGIDDPTKSKRIDFVGGMRGLSELEKRVNSGEMAVAFAMHPTSMAELMAVADNDKIMPPKSTWFEPKLRSGVFVHLF